MLSERSRGIARVFHRYLKNGDESELVNIKLDDLELAVKEYSRYRSELAYPAMQRRLKELKGKRKHRLESVEQWKNFGLGFVLGIIVTLIMLLFAGVFRACE
ncbi:MAG: hypothetical protein GY807_20710 [Gammaproteobacteria bacterium]|nr:hypothetical protein [Gammaproteobacteria bacterium]